ncbi:hypothetical protein PR048_007521 [Dryococelus australis]|uniref:Uncharacterized protein n=1 Tax=Dryococelus australis TaxID=614101 RepID=A0ABQ9HVD2_9NEOP|nr:hypothetical protein PR048_007521 [Dryococelus australis]
MIESGKLVGQCRVCARIFWELGPSAQRCIWRNFWAMVYDPTNIAAVQGLGIFFMEAYWLRARETLAKGTDNGRLRDDGGLGCWWCEWTRGFHTRRVKATVRGRVLDADRKHVWLLCASTTCSGVTTRHPLALASEHKTSYRPPPATFTTVANGQPLVNDERSCTDSTAEGRIKGTSLVPLAEGHTLGCSVPLPRIRTATMRRHGRDAHFKVTKPGNGPCLSIRTTSKVSTTLNQERRAVTPVRRWRGASTPAVARSGVISIPRKLILFQLRPRIIKPNEASDSSSVVPSLRLQGRVPRQSCHGTSKHTEPHAYAGCTVLPRARGSKQARTATLPGSQKKMIDPLPHCPQPGGSLLLLQPPATTASCYYSLLLLQPPATTASCYYSLLLLQPPATAASCYCSLLLLQPPVTTASCYYSLLLLQPPATTASCYYSLLLLQPPATTASCYYSLLLLHTHAHLQYSECQTSLWSTASPSNYSTQHAAEPIRATVAERLACSSPTMANPGRDAPPPPRIFACGIVLEDAAGRRVFSGISRFPRPIIPALLHIRLDHPHRLLRPRCQEQRKYLHSHVIVYIPPHSEITVKSSETQKCPHDVRVMSRQPCIALASREVRVVSEYQHIAHVFHSYVRNVHLKHCNTCQAAVGCSAPQALAATHVAITREAGGSWHGGGAADTTRQAAACE